MVTHNGSAQPVQSSSGSDGAGGHGKGRWCVQVFLTGLSALGTTTAATKGCQVCPFVPSGHQHTARAWLLPMALQHCTGGSTGPCEPKVTGESDLVKVHLSFPVELLGLDALQHWTVSTQPACTSE